MNYRTPTQSKLDEEGLAAALEEAGSGWGMHLSADSKRRLMGEAIRAYLASQEGAAPSEEPAAWQIKDKHGNWITLPGDWQASENLPDRFYRPLFASPAVAPVEVSVKEPDELYRAAKALINNLWIGVVSGKRSHEENWREFERRFPGVKWVHEALAASIIPATKPAVGVEEAARELVKSFAIYTVEDDDGIRLSTGGHTVAHYGERSKEGIAILRLEFAVQALSAALSAGTATPKPEVEK